SDNDGVSDLVEAGHIDSNEDGLLDNLADLISDLTLLPDTDTDGLPDFFELFSNGVDRDLILAGIRAALDLDEDGRIDSTTDVDRDGLMDVIDNAIGAFGSLPDYDGDGIPNHLDEDDDGDGIPDSEENDQFIYFTGEDADADGIDDGVDAEVNGVILGVDTNNNGVRDDRELPDLDGDGIADFLDNDADNDGILDNVDTEIALPVIPEPTTPTIPGTPTTPDQSSGADADVDGDGIPDSRDVSINTGNDVTTGSGAMAQGFYMIILAILGITARGRRHAKSLVTPLLTSLLLALGLIAPAASADSISAGGAIGFTRFSPEVNIEPTQNDYTDAGVFFDLGYHFSPEWAALLQYANLGEVNVNTADIPYRAVAAMAQYRPEWARSDSGWGLSLRLGASSVETGAERGLNLEKKESTFVMYSVGADFDVSESERLEILLSSYASDAKSLTFGYRVLFDL
ncbi:MAG: outer membrane beta-barrel protein, partial [Thalassolituus sp.]